MNDGLKGALILAASAAITGAGLGAIAGGWFALAGAIIGAVVGYFAGALCVVSARADEQAGRK